MGQRELHRVAFPLKEEMGGLGPWTERNNTLNRLETLHTLQTPESESEARVPEVHSSPPVSLKFPTPQTTAEKPGASLGGKSQQQRVTNALRYAVSSDTVRRGEV